MMTADSVLGNKSPCREFYVGFEIVYQKAEKNENNKIDFMEIECEK
jgi:hypothetical protein